MYSKGFFRKSDNLNFRIPKDINEMLYESPKTQGNSSSSNSIKSSYIFYVFYAAALLGLPYYPRAITDKANEIPIFLKIWCFCTCVIKSVLYLIFLATGALYIPYKVTTITFYTNSCVTAFLTFYLIRHRKKISLSIRRVCNIFRFLEPDQKTGGKYCSLQMILLLLVVSYSIVAYKKGLESIKYSYSYNVLGVDLLMVYRVSISAVIANSSVTIGITTILCDGVFITFKNVLLAFKARLKGRYRIGHCCRRTILEDIVLFRRIFTCYQQVEDSLSPVLLSLNVLCMVIVLNNLSILLTRTLPLMTIIAIMIAFAQAMLPFVYLIFSVANVTREYDYLKQCLIRCSEAVSLTRASDTDMSLFTLLSDGIRSTNFYFTAGEMYIISKELILTAAGLMVTYGVIEYQLSTHDI